MDKQLAVLSFALGMERKIFHQGSGHARDEEAGTYSGPCQMEEGHIAHIQANIDSLNRKASGRRACLRPRNKIESRYSRPAERERAEPSFSRVTAELSALRIALAIENDLYGFYGRAALHATEPDAIAVFQKLAGWEKGHREMLEAQYETMKEDLWSDIGFAPF